MPIITDFIRNTKRELCAEKVEDALEMLDLEWSKDDDTKTQCNRLNTIPLHRGNVSNKNGPAWVKQRMQWEAPSKLLAVDNPLLLPEREVHAEISINCVLDQEIPKGGYVNMWACVYTSAGVCAGVFARARTCARMYEHCAGDRKSVV